MTRNAWVFGAIALMFGAIGIYFGVRATTPVPPESPAVRNFFAQTFPDAKGNAHNLGQWQGKTLVVNFWATWCAPCVEEMPELMTLSTDFSSRNVQVLGIGIDSAANVLDFSQKYQISYPLYISGLSGTDLSRQFGNQSGGLPFTVLISAQGDVVKTYIGRLNMNDLRADIEKLK